MAWKIQSRLVVLFSNTVFWSGNIKTISPMVLHLLHCNCCKFQLFFLLSWIFRLDKECNNLFCSLYLWLHLWMVTKNASRWRFLQAIKVLLPDIFLWLLLCIFKGIFLLKGFCGFECWWETTWSSLGHIG